MIETHHSQASQKNLRFRIVKCAMFLFSREGIKPVTMDRIAKELQISKRTLYEIFNDKEELLLEGVCVFKELMNRYSEDLAQKVDNVLDLMLIMYQLRLNEMRFVTPRFYSDMRKYPSVVRFMRDSMNRETDKVQAFMKCGVEQGLFRKDVNFEVIHRVIFSQVEFVMQNLLPERYPLVELFDSFILVCMRGFSTEKGVRQIEDFVKRRGCMADNFPEALYEYWPDNCDIDALLSNKRNRLEVEERRPDNDAKS